MVKIANVSNPAAWGAEVTTDDGTRMQFAQPRGTATVLFAIHSNGEWCPARPVDVPARFGPHEFRKWAEVRSWVDAFVNAGRDEATDDE